MFQKSVFRRYLRGLDPSAVDEAWRRFESAFLNEEKQRNIRKSSEIQYQEGFCRDLFCHVFGYTINPEPGFNLKTEQKNQNMTSKSDSRSADAAVILNGTVRAIIELKGCNTLDLSKVEPQAFGYKAHHPGCRYVVISNFERLRFYIDTADKYLEFDLFHLSREAFEALYLCLALTQIARDVPARIKADSLTSETEITANFYKDYSVFKRNLFNNIVEHNADRFDKLFLFRKTQKLLDRLIFIFFCEDRGLLTANTIAKIIRRWQMFKDNDAYQPLYALFKRHFVYIDKGHQDKEITVFGYNGGLFREDDALDTFVIDDEILLGAQKLSNYDFESDVSVDILGHIFEHSLTEIEEVQTQIIEEGSSSEAKTEKAKKTSKRKKDGVFYTPAYITKYIVENTVGRLCDEKKKALAIDDETYAERNKKNTKKEQEAKKKLADTLEDYRQWLLGLKICDPACGSGAFLNAALQFLKHEHRLIDIYKAHIYGHTLILSDVDTSILENNLYGVDINEESVEIARLSLWLATASRGRKLTDLAHNIKCGNSLIDDPAVAGDKAFCWEKAFPDVFARGGFDVVIGNPPYGLKQPNNTSNDELGWYRKFEVASYKIDVFHLFFERGLSICNEKSMFGYITSNSYLTNKHIQPLRRLLLRKTSIISIVNHDEKVFPDPSIDVCTIIVSKPHDEKNVINVMKTDIHRQFHLVAEVNQSDWNDNVDNAFIVNSMPFSLVDCVPLKEICKSYFGIQAYDRKASISATANNSEYIPIIDGEDIHPYTYAKPTKFFQFIKSNVKSGGDWAVYCRERIVIRQIGKVPVVGMCQKEILASNTLYSVYPKDESSCNVKYILCILNSKLIKYWWSQMYADQKNLFPKIKGFQIDSLPIKKVSYADQNPFIALADAQISANEAFRKYVQRFQNRVQSTLGVQKMTEKLSAFYKYAFGVFLGELKKQKVKLSLCEQDEWEEYFNGCRQDCTRLLLEIDENDRKIDQLVYELYGLTEEEIAVIESDFQVLKL